MTRDSTAPSVVWFRRDLRTHDHPALLAAAERSPSAVGLFVLDDVLLAPAGKPRVDFRYGCLCGPGRRTRSPLGGWQGRW